MYPPYDPMAQPQDTDPRQRVAEQMLLAQNTLKPRAYWDFRLKVNDFETPDDQLMQKYKMQQAPTAPQGQRPQGQVGMTTMTPEKEAALRAQLKGWGLPQSEIDRKVLEHKVQSGLR